MRPVASQSSAGVSTGISISWPPIASISSRTICSTFRWTRQPSGISVHTPAETCRSLSERPRSERIASSNAVASFASAPETTRSSRTRVARR